MMDKDMGQMIYEVLKETIPDTESLEIIYTNHYLFTGVVTGYDEKHHLLMIRDAMYCHAGCKREFDLDVLKISEALEKELPIEVTFDRVLTIEDGKTFRFYVEIKKEEE